VSTIDRPPGAATPPRLLLITGFADAAAALGLDRIAPATPHLARYAEHIVSAVSGVRGAPGVAVSIREKDWPRGDVEKLVGRVQPALAERGVPLLVHTADVGWAAGIGVTGIHLPSGVDAASARAAIGRGGLVGCSTHGEADLGAIAGADYAVFGPVFDTPSKRAFGPPQGLAALTRFVAAAPCPVLALGGVTPANVPAVLAARAQGVACIRAVFGQKAPGDAVRRFVDAFPH
jgi:thiamine-phosphate pyrophosphorylase